MINTNKEIHGLVETLINNNILSNCTQLVNDLIESNIFESYPNKMFTIEDIHNFCETPIHIIEGYYDPEGLLDKYDLISMSCVENLHDTLFDEYPNLKDEELSLLDILKELIK